MVKYCPKCKVTESGNFCTDCGAELKELPMCEFCNGYLYPRNKHCSNCGKKRGKVK